MRFFRILLPLLISLGVASITYFTVGWWGFWLIFPWIGVSISLGLFISSRYSGIKKDIGRRVTILLIAPVFLVFLGLLQHENLQLEETVFYIAVLINFGVFTRVLIHYAIAKILGPLIWGRGFCGWACWTAAVLDWLPIHENRPIPPKITRFRYVTLAISLVIPIIFILTGYNYMDTHIRMKFGKPGQLSWFLIGNGLYYVIAIALAFIYRKKRAFCKIACPVSLIMKLPTTVARLKKRPTGIECIKCGQCNRHCPMDINVMDYISAGKPVSSSECILCNMCSHVCPVQAIS